MNLFRSCIDFFFKQNKRLYFDSSRLLSNTTNGYVSVIKDENNRVAEIRMQRPPVNSLHLEMMQDITEAIKSLEKEDYRGFILSSSCPTTFSSGLDLNELYRPNEQRFRTMWNAFSEMWRTLYMTPLITVAAINGHAPAGGCMIAMSCDHRIMKKSNAKIGIPGVKLGIVVPKWMSSLLVSNMGLRNTEKSLTMGLMYTPEQALSLNVVDELADDDEDMISKAERYMQQALSLPVIARQLQKLEMRKEIIREYEEYKESELERMTEFVVKKETGDFLENYLKKLKSRL